MMVSLVYNLYFNGDEAIMSNHQVNTIISLLAKAKPLPIKMVLIID